ncbi:MAG: signal peptidase I [Gammaproteobacteria bacterium]|nr:signal peptidase I [Gammaproteobacteria bacterium]
MELLLYVAVISFGFISLIDIIFFAKQRYKLASEIPGFETLSKQDKQGLTKAPLLADYARSLFPVLLLVFCLRSFVGELFEVPTGSLLPTVQLGDYLLVNKFIYGVRLPIFNTELFRVGVPKRGDIMLFNYPVDPNVVFIKTVIGIPGDKISYINKQLFINGQTIPNKFLSKGIEPANASLGNAAVELYQENIGGHVHTIYNTPGMPPIDFTNLIVPPGEYFMMGDNRDYSEDSRYWGFVPYTDIVGKAYRIVFSWNSDTHRVRWNRIGKKLP